MPKKKSAGKTTPKKQSKAAFVRSLPATTPAKEVVAKAKAANLALSENYVYNVRATTKSSVRKKGRGDGAPKQSPKKPSSRSGSSEANFRRLVVDLGLARARALLGEVESGLQALISGR
jgi:hypothetical protein